MRTVVIPRFRPSRRTALLLAGAIVCGSPTARAQSKAISSVQMGQTPVADAPGPLKSAVTNAVTRAGVGGAANAPGAPQELYLDVSIDSQASALISRFVMRDGRLSASGADLRALGIMTDKLNITQAADVALDSIPGLHYRFDPARLTIDLQVPENLRTPHSFNARESPAIPSASSLHGLLLNYELYSQTTPEEETSLYSEIRYFSPYGVTSQTGILEWYKNLHRYIRYDTNWIRSWQDTMSTLQLGDTISSSSSWSRAVRIGGIQWRRNFTVRPDLITYPIPSLRGATAVPSSVDLYINNIRQFSSQVPTGPFVLNQVPGISGAGIATVVTRDALGRSIATSVPLYVDTRLLAAGLSSYSFEVGFLRRNYGFDSFNYDRRPAVSETTSYGLTSSVTLSSHAEATPGVWVAGGGGLVEIGLGGVISASVSASAGRFAGQQVSLGYQLIEPTFSINEQSVRTIGNYGDLAARVGDLVPTATDQATVALPFFSRQTLAISYIGSTLRDGPTSRIGSLSYMLNLGRQSSLNVSVFRDFGSQPTSGVFIGMSVGLGESRSGGTGTTLNANVGRQSGQNTYNVSATRPADYGGGLGWGVQAGRAGTINYQQAQAQWLGNLGQVEAVVQSFGGQAATSVDVSGGAVWMDNTLKLSRRIDDSFALISTGGVAGIPVLHENRVIGKTDSNGYLLVPDLNAYQHNLISIDTMRLPADVQVASTEQDLVPESRSGLLGEFGLSRYLAATVILQDADGAVLPPGARVHHIESGKDTIVGYDGQTFIDHLQPHNHLQVVVHGQTCEVAFDYAPPKDGNLPTFGPLRCALGAHAGAAR